MQCIMMLKKKERKFDWLLCAGSILIGWKWTAEEGQVQACSVAKFISPPFSLSSFSHSFTDRNFDRTSVRSRSFRRLNRAFSVLRRTKSGTAVANETTEERDNLRNANIPPEGECGSCKYCIRAFVSWSSWNPDGLPAKHQLELARRPARPEEDQLGNQLDQIKPVKTNKPSCFIRGPVLALTLACIVVSMFIIVNYVV